MLWEFGIDITVPLKLDILSRPTYMTPDGAQYVYLVTANLAKTEYPITDPGLTDLQQAVFDYVTGHNNSRFELDPPHHGWFMATEESR